MEVMQGAKKYHQENRTRIALSAFNITAQHRKSRGAKRHCQVQEYGMKLPDAIILPTAQVHRCELVTRNTKKTCRYSGSDHTVSHFCGDRTGKLRPV